jgi:hypothetical protein
VSASNCELEAIESSPRILAALANVMAATDEASFSLGILADEQSTKRARRDEGAFERRITSSQPRRCESRTVQPCVRRFISRTAVCCRSFIRRKMD